VLSCLSRLISTGIHIKTKQRTVATRANGCSSSDTETSKNDGSVFAGSSSDSLSNIAVLMTPVTVTMVMMMLATAMSVILPQSHTKRLLNGSWHSGMMRENPCCLSSGRKIPFCHQQHQPNDMHFLLVGYALAMYFAARNMFINLPYLH